MTQTFTFQQSDHDARIRVVDMRQGNAEHSCDRNGEDGADNAPDCEPKCQRHKHYYWVELQRAAKHLEYIESREECVGTKSNVSVP